ncbi:FG-GAP and VCBS repeat-containing protein [Streptomyces bottropensis]|uniref:FG-GAP and VCBS repeat-containing protein n=1 Tax=Streptomyces bottropensis TaxID=42235 RepID=UPI00369E268D
MPLRTSRRTIPGTARRTSSRTVAGSAAVVAALLAAPLVVAAPAAAAPKAPIADFNGDGFADLATAAPEATVSGVEFAGYVTVVNGSVSGADTAHPLIVSQALPWVPGEPSPYRFGMSTAARDLDGDGYTDLVVGAYRGAAVLWGSPSGLNSATALSGTVSKLTGGDFNGDGSDDLALGNDGILQVRLGPFTRDGVPAGTNVFPVNERKETWDVIAGDMNGDGKDDLVTTHGFEERSYATLWWPGTTTGIDTEHSRSTGSASVGGVVADVNMDGFGDYVGRQVDAVSEMRMYDAGNVRIVYGGPDGPSARITRITQDTAGVPGVSEVGYRNGDDSDYGDQFGASLAAGDVTGDGYPDIAVGVPGEDIGSIRDAGSVVLLKGGASGLTGTGAQAFDQSDSGVPGASEAGDEFGGNVALLDVNANDRADLAVAAPKEDGTYKNSGAVWLFRGSRAGLTTTNITSFGPSVLGAPEKGALFGREFAK